MHKSSPILTALALVLGCGAPAETIDRQAREPSAALKVADSGEDPAIDPSEGAIFFGQLCGGDESDHTLTLTNIGGDWLDISGLALTGPGFWLSDAPSLPRWLDVGQGADVTVHFAPPVVRVAPYTGNLRVVSNDPLQPILDIPIDGLALPGSVRLAPRQHDFGSLADGGSLSYNLTLRTSGGCPVSLGDVRVTGNLSGDIHLGALPDRIDPGEAETLNVRLRCNGEDDIVDVLLRFIDTNNRSVGTAQVSGYCNPS